MVVPGLIFISVEQHDGYFRAGHQKSEKAEAQHFKREPQKAGKLRGKRYGSGEKDITPLADVPVLFKAVPELQQEKFYSD